MPWSPVQDGSSEAFDSQYITEELVITIEADQMIYFDLLDLPGLDSLWGKTEVKRGSGVLMCV